MTYIDHIAPVRATGPIAVPSGPAALQPGRWRPGWSANDVPSTTPPTNPFDTTSNHQHPHTEGVTMKYLMLVADDPEADPNETGEGTLDIDTWVSTNQAAGRWMTGNRLRPAEDATTVRRRGGKVLVTDGPFAESHEFIVGFDILDCADLDEAIAMVAQHPNAAHGRIELRPFWPLADDAG